MDSSVFLGARICAYEYVNGRRKGTTCGRAIKKRNRPLCGLHMRHLERHIQAQLSPWHTKGSIPVEYGDDMSITPSMLWEDDDMSTMPGTPPEQHTPLPDDSELMALLGKLLVSGIRGAPAPEAPAPVPPPPPPAPVPAPLTRAEKIRLELFGRR